MTFRKLRQDDTFLGRRALAIAIPTIFNHDYVTSHLGKENLAEWETMANVAAIPVKHDHSRSPCGKLEDSISKAGNID